MTPKEAGDNSATIVLLFGCLLFLLCLPGLCMNQAQAWFDEMAAEAAQSDSLPNGESEADSTPVDGSGSRPTVHPTGLETIPGGLNSPERKASGTFEASPCTATSTRPSTAKGQ